MSDESKTPPLNPATEGIETEPVEEKGVDPMVEALLFSAEVPLAAKRIAELAGSSKSDVLEAIDRLNVFYGETHRAFRISPIASGFQLMTLPTYGDVLSKLHKERVPTRLSRAALETLSIIVFKQPVTRAEIDAIRGVSASDRVLRNLMDRKLVRISGRAEAPGRPLLYGTTREFLGYFGLDSLRDLPRSDELAALLAGDVPGTLPEDEDLVADEPAAPSAEPEEVTLAERGLEEALEEESFEEEQSALEEDHLSHSGEESDTRENIPET